MTVLRSHYENLQKELQALRQAQQSNGLGVPYNRRIQVYSYESGGQPYDQYSWFSDEKKERQRTKGGMRHKHIPRGPNDGLMEKIREHNERCDAIRCLRKAIAETERQLFGVGTPRLPDLLDKYYGQFDHHASCDPTKTGVVTKRFSIAVFRWVWNKQGSLKRSPVLYRVKGDPDEAEALYAIAKLVVERLTTLTDETLGYDMVFLSAVAKDCGDALLAKHKAECKAKRAEQKPAKPPQRLHVRRTIKQQVPASEQCQ